MADHPEGPFDPLGAVAVTAHPPAPVVRGQMPYLAFHHGLK